MTENADAVRGLEVVWRAESGRVLATLIRLLGDFELAEEALTDAFLAASESWPRDGLPANPRAWLVSTGRFKAIDQLRRKIRQRALTRSLPVEEEAQMPAEAEPIADDELRLIFVCCHPALGPEAQVAMTLREVCGLSTEEIAAAFLSKPATVAQRIVRGKARIRELGLPYEVPEGEALTERLDAVLHVLYLIFSEGYSASHGDAAIRSELCGEAIRLGRVLYGLMPAGDVAGLLGLMLLDDSRRAARLDGAGDIVLIGEQDRALWDREQIAEGIGLVNAAFADPPVAGYAIEAAIAAEHALAESTEATNWAAIVALYDLLMRAEPSPIVELNRAVAVAMRDGPRAGLRLMDGLAGALASYRYFHAARADLLRRLGETGAARQAYAAALELTQQAAERRFLERRVAGL